MTIAFNPTDTADKIAGVAISGVTVCDADQIPQSGQLICPILFPQPNDWLSNIAQGAKTIDVDDASESDFSYALHYVFLFSELGGIGSFDTYLYMVQKLETILDVILNDASVTDFVEISLNGIDGLGVVQDPSGNQYWGALISFQCQERA